MYTSLESLGKSYNLLLLLKFLRPTIDVATSLRIISLVTGLGKPNLQVVVIPVVVFFFSHAIAIILMHLVVNYSFM